MSIRKLTAHIKIKCDKDKLFKNKTVEQKKWKNSHKISEISSLEGQN